MLTHIESGLRDIFTDTDEYAGAVLRPTDGVSVRFGGVLALSEVTFEVDQHDVVAIVGPNGAGKSTLLNAVGNLVRSTGRIRFFDRNIQGVPAARIAHGGIGRSFQDPQLVDNNFLSVPAFQVNEFDTDKEICARTRILTSFQPGRPESAAPLLSCPEGMLIRPLLVS